MSSTHVQLWLIALAIIAYAVFALGLRWQSRADRSRRGISAVAALLCVTAPTAAALLGGSEGPVRLVPSLQFAAVGLCALAVYALLSSSSRKRTAHLDEMAAACCRPGDEAALAPDPESATVEQLDSGSTSDPIADSFGIVRPPGPANTLEPESFRSSDAGGALSGATVIINADHVGDSELDLDETEREFRSFRRTSDPIDLPDRSLWMDRPSARNSSGELMPGDAWIGAEPATFDEATEAEMVVEPTSPAPPRGTGGAGGSPADSDRLNGVLRDARNHGKSLEFQVTRLLQDHQEDSARAARDALSLARRETESALRLNRAERLVDAERQARVAAEELVDSQRGLIEELQQDVQRLQRHSRTLETTLEQRLQMLGKASDTARIAARIARGAANARVESERLLGLERAARERQQQATDRAVAIARNAIAALPVHAHGADDGDVDTVAASDADASTNGSHAEPFDR